MKHLRLSTAVAGISLLMAGQAFAAGYYVDEQSALRLGDAFSGGAASASDASAAFYGPASMILVKDEVVINAAAIAVNTKFDGSGKFNGAVPIAGEAAKADSVDVLPSLYFVKHLDETLALGGYINAPYATGVEFGKDSVVRYHAADSQITGIDAGVSVALRLNSMVSVGGTVFAQYLKAKTAVAVNTDAICAGAEAGGQAPVGTCAGLGLTNYGQTTDDGYFEMKGHNTVMGFQLGTLVEFSDNSRLGLNYRSKAEHSLAGTATATFPANAGLLGLTDTSAEGRVDISTPEVINLSYFHRLGDLSLQGDVSYTRWSRFETLSVQSRNPLIKELTAAPQVYDWSDSYRAAFGANYQVSPALVVRGGVAFDTTPISNKNTKVDFAFDDYKALSLGMSYAVAKDLTLDAGVQHTLEQERDVTQDDGMGSVISGKASTEVTSFALGLRWAL